jgi:uncharacterized protein YndB with AHSA1/START domain
MGTEHISASRVIDADAQELFDLVADPSMHAVFDGSGSVRSVWGGSRKLGPGDRFTTNMRIGVPYLISNKVVEYEEGRRLAWAHIGGWRWRYEFEPVDGGTLVTETFDWSTSLAKPYIQLAGWGPRNLQNMERTLERLDAYVTNRSAGT